jgi:hypothetical protein
MQNSSGGNNFTNNSTDLTRINQIMAWAATWIATPATPSDPPTDACPTCHTALTDSRIRLHVAGIYFHKSPAGGIDYSLSNDNYQCQTFAQSDNPSSVNPNILDIYFTEGTYGSAGGYTQTPPWEQHVLYDNFDFVNNIMEFGAYSANNDWVYSMEVAHEFGHVFDLCHTYNGGGCDFYGPGDMQAQGYYFDDIFGNVRSYPIGTTPPSYYAFHDRCWGCNLNISPDQYTNNVMGGTQDARYFSPLQIAKMHRSMALASSRRYVTPNSYSSTHPLIITSNQTWDWNMRIYTDIEIQTGATLTLTCKLIMPDGANIIVHKGAKLVVNGGVISNVDNDSRSLVWEGITVLGDRTLSQTFNNQGYVELTNATVANAQDAVTLGDGWAQDGGWVKADQSTFINNRRCFQFLSYKDPSFSSSTDYTTWNKSRITNCTLKCDNLCPGYTVGTGDFITMWDVVGVGLYGNTIENAASSSVLGATDRGRGIFSIDASYRLHNDISTISNNGLCSYPSGAPNTFKSLTKGIEFFASPGNPDLYLQAHQNSFLDISNFGISVQNDVQSDIWNNLFTFSPSLLIADPGTIPNIIAIQSQGSQNINIRTNQINWQSPNPCSYIGIDMENSMSFGPTDEISGNTLNNTAPSPTVSITGNNFIGDNELVDVKCNTYTNLSKDWHIEYSFVTIGPSTFMKSQGSPGNGMNNTFSAPNPSFISNVDLNISGTMPFSYFDVMSTSPVLSGTTSFFNYTSTTAPPCIPTTVCDIYNGWDANPNFMSPVKIEKNTAQNQGVMELIYAGKFDEAKNRIANLNDKDMQQYYNSVINIYEAGRNFKTMNSSDISSLERFTCEASQRGEAARQILTFFTGKSYEIKRPENVITPSNATTDIQLQKAEEPKFIVYPNPANNQFTIFYKFSGNYRNTNVKWFDALGRLVNQKTISDIQGIISYNKQDLGNPGIYHCIIENEGKQIGSANIVLQ